MKACIFCWSVASEKTCPRANSIYELSDNDCSAIVCSALSHATNATKQSATGTCFTNNQNADSAAQTTD